MIDQEVRVRCIEAAAAVPGNPNTLALAREFYAFVTERGPDKEPEEAEELSASQQLRVAQQTPAKKGARK